MSHKKEATGINNSVAEILELDILRLELFSENYFRLGIWQVVLPLR